MKLGQRGMFVPLAFLAFVNFGVVTAAVSGVIMATSNGVPAIPAVGVGTGATAVASLAWYIAKKLLSGEITPLPITTLIGKMEDLIDRLEKNEEVSRADRAEMRDIVKASTEAQFAIHEFLRQQQPTK